MAGRLPLRERVAAHQHSERVDIQEVADPN
jgi:hypothetical protein